MSAQRSDPVPMSTTKIPAVEVQGLSKSFGPVVALDGVDISVGEGEYFVLLGPSGGGKTTLLRVIGGFIRPNAGKVLLHGHDVSALPPDKRPTTMVFQSYALFPHMSVARNVGYGLRIKRLASKKIGERVDAMLDLVGLAGYGARMPHELSGGQQQRVQLARSLILDRDILLLDEPLAALDANLRKDMCLELKRLQETVGITFVHVTHNQEEAMTIADRIAIIADGKMIESGSARDIYERPVKRFTADFVGENNVLSGTLAAVGKSKVTIDLGFGRVDVPPGEDVPTKGATVSFSVRSELLELLPAKGKLPSATQALDATYREAIYLGLVISHMVSLPDGTLVTVRKISGGTENRRFERGQPLRICWKTTAARLHVS